MKGHPEISSPDEDELSDSEDSSLDETIGNSNDECQHAVKFWKYFDGTGYSQEKLHTPERFGSLHWLHEFYVHICNRRCLTQPALTRTSRQMRRECLPVFYAINEFHLQLPKESQ